MKSTGLTNDLPNKSSSHNEFSELCIKLIPNHEGTAIRDRGMQRNILNLLAFMTRKLIDSLIFFHIKKHYDLFDPHVGETSCQVRSYINILLAKEFEESSIQKINKRVSQLQKNHDVLMREVQVISVRNIKNNSMTLREWVRKIGCCFHVSRNEIFILGSYLLTEYKVESKPWDTFIDYNKMTNDANASRRSIKNAVRYYQIELSARSCYEVARWVERGDGVREKKTLVESSVYLDDNGRHVLPCYLSTKIMLNCLGIDDIPILFSISIEEEQVLILYPSIAKKGLILKKDHRLNIMNTPCLIIMGESSMDVSGLDSGQEILKKFSKHGLTNIILANTADHPQYVGKKLAEHRKNPCSNNAQNTEEGRGLADEVRRQVEWAHVFGCCLSNKDLFCVRHICCDTPANCLRQKQRTVQLSPF